MRGLRVVEQAVQGGDDQALVIQRGEINFSIFEFAFSHMPQSYSAMCLIYKFIKLLIDRKSQKLFINCFFIKQHVEDVLVQYGRTSVPNMSAERCSRRTRPSE